MPANFPSNPATNQTYTFNGRQWRYNGAYWELDSLAVSTGSTGATGATGIQGNVGLTGSPGVTGSTGATGAAGVDGATGATGIQGNVGLTGSPGVTGSTGATGAAGVDGATGATGLTGPEGPATISDGAGNSYPTGYKAMPPSSNATGTLVLSDAGKHLLKTANVSIPLNSTVAFSIGTVVTVIANATTINIIPVSGVTLRLANTVLTGTRSLNAHGMAGLIKVDTDTWYISGNGLL